MLALAVALAAAWPAPTSAAAPAASQEVTPDLRDLTAWLELQRARHGAAFPDEARLFYRQGLMAREAGRSAEAERLVRGAAELDPSFVEPHLTIASWSLFREPSQSLLHLATVLELARGNFVLQHALVANLVYLGLQSVLLGLLALGLLVVVVHADDLRHPWQERLTAWLSPVTARWWAWAIVLLPFLAGLGPVLPTLAALGLLWPVLRGRERAAFVALLAAAVASPIATHALDRLATPLHEERAPLYGVPLLENQAPSPSAEARLARLSAAQPDNAFLHFGLAWTAKRRGDLARAEAGYREVLRLWPDDDRALVNLGHVLALRGRDEDALALFTRATQVAPDNAAAWFNASQIHTRRFDYRAATEALGRASALDFDLVKAYQARGADDGTLAFVDCWIAPATFWRAASTAPPAGDAARALPPAWRGRIEASGWPFAAAALCVAVLALVAGRAEHRHTPLRSCSNCGVVVCRRCAHRRRELALCPSCAEVEARAESPDFARVLLLQHARRRRRGRHLIETALATLVPGFGLVVHRRVVRPFAMLAAAAALLAGTAGMTAPFAFEPRVGLGDGGGPAPLVVALWIALYAASLAAHARLEARRRAQEAQLAAPVRSRSAPPTRHAPPAAAA
uniref:Tetratricopeptide repeat protein n=1 Tax=Eiseniibacteriota bacterium TaxID=2212470 RepID=A0A832I0Q0_UNCEI